ncbi:hypothetical protein Bca4012_064046 [Brassica carinata]|uniref:F-box domain-containing protein n=1 Tax=Brassica carinata TaxID=52824 RepID=A0A8X7SE81_BRACI|nr:hypothetical protein Bca52824_033447 [Brassica carinata]
METGRRRRRGSSFPDAIVVEIIARLPLRSISRFKSVCKQWRSLIESSYFRSLFVSLHRNSSSSWSLMFPIKFQYPITEAIGFHGCERWDLPKSPASYLTPFQPYPNGDHYYVDSSHGLVWIEANVGTDGYVKTKSFVGNPISQDWVEIPPPPDPLTKPSSLVTRVVNGVVSSFKVVRTCTKIIEPRPRERRYAWRMYVYSSETGAWAFRTPRSPFPLRRAGSNRPLNLNGMLYVWEKRQDDLTGTGVLVSHDFYGEDDYDQCRIIPLPVSDNKHVRRCSSSSGGDVIYVEILYQRLKVWKLKNSNNSSDGEWWQLTREEINMASVGFDVNCFPLGVNPFDTDLIYLWSRQHSCVVSGNLRTQEFTLHQETETLIGSEDCWRLNTSDSKKHMEAIYDPASVITLSQFVLPQWMDPVPRPPN